MKKLNTYITMMIMALMTLSMTSCDEDVLIADTLWGEWEGQMYVTSYYNGHRYDASYSNLAFDRDPCHYTSGSGYWVDYYSNAPWDYHANHIRWNVSNGVIRIHFIEDGGFVDIYDYSLGGSYFSGVIYNDRNDALHFRLRKTVDYSHDYDNYYWGWDDDWCDYWYYSQKMTRSANDSISNDSTDISTINCTSDISSKTPVRTFEPR